MANTRGIAAAKDERARKAYLKDILDRGGPEALYAALYRSTLEGLIELNYDFEEALYAKLQARIPEERRREIQAEVDAPEPVAEPTPAEPTPAELERARRAQEAEARRQEAWYAREREAAKRRTLTEMARDTHIMSDEERRSRR